MLTTKFHVEGYFITQFHHYFQFSLFQGIKHAFEIKDGDLGIQPSEEAPAAP